MRNLSIRTGLLLVLFTFAMMLVVGAAVGVLMLGRANGVAQSVHEIEAQAALAVDAREDTNRARFALALAGSAQAGGHDAAGREAALHELRAALDGAAAQRAALRKAPGTGAQGDALRRALDASATALATRLGEAADALESGAAAATTPADGTPQGAAAPGADAASTPASPEAGDLELAAGRYAADVEAFGAYSTRRVDDALAQSRREHRWVIAMVVVGLSGALVLIVATHLLLRRFVTGPLGAAVASLNQIASNDLAVSIPQGGCSEIGQLFEAMRRMQGGLTGTVMNVRRCCDAINTGAKEIAAGNLDLSSRTEQQSASLEQTAASMEQLTSTVKQNAGHAREASTLAANATEVAQRGGQVVERVVETMNAISRSSDRIADITGMIDGIAFQTNILALNAAVEAARAGEQGRGFAVVAGEVRTLAQRSAVAAREIKELIGLSTQDVHNGGNLVAEAGATMHEIVQAIERVSGLMKEIASSTVEQSAGIEQVEQAVCQMDQVTQQNAALVEQAAAAAGSLEQQASEMADAVATFRLLQAEAA